MENRDYLSRSRQLERIKSDWRRDPAMFIVAVMGFITLIPGVVLVWFSVWYFMIKPWLMEPGDVWMP